MADGVYNNGTGLLEADVEAECDVQRTDAPLTTTGRPGIGFLAILERPLINTEGGIFEAPVEF